MEQKDLQRIKQQFSIIGNSAQLNRGIEIAVQVALTDLSVLITGESGVGKEHFPKIIHQYSARKHGYQYPKKKELLLQKLNYYRHHVQHEA